MNKTFLSILVSICVSQLAFTQTLSIEKVSNQTCINEPTIYKAFHPEADWYEWSATKQDGFLGMIPVETADTIGVKHDTLHIYWDNVSSDGDMMLMSTLQVKAYKSGTLLASTYLNEDDIISEPASFPELEILAPSDTIACGAYTELFKYQYPTSGRERFSVTMIPENAGEIIRKDLRPGWGMGDPINYIRINWNPDFSGSVEITVTAENDCGIKSKTFNLYKLAEAEYNKVTSLTITPANTNSCVELDESDFQQYTMIDSSVFASPTYQIGNSISDVYESVGTSFLIENNDTIVAISNMYIDWNNYAYTYKKGDSVYLKTITAVGCNAPVSNYIRNYDIADSILIRFCEYDTFFSDTLITACNSHEYKDSIYTMSTVIRDTVWDDEYIDTLYSVKLQIGNSTTDTIPVVENEAVEINGIVYTVSGYFAQSFSSVEGCDSTVVYNVVIDTNTVTDIEHVSKKYIDCIISPNPAQQFINVESNTIISDISIIDLTGQVVEKFSVFDFVYTISLDKIEAGTYMLLLETANGYKEQELIIKE